MSIETRIQRIEQALKPQEADKRFLLIMRKVSEETQAEAISRYEREHNIKVDEDKHNLMIVELVKDKEDREKLKQEKDNAN